ncbi:aldose 1-epimerase [Pullulanibacillus pueri]|uniref:Aldose 1-epimerase n=1 Tax=Pullulanibacillus pueri TaxID=1437324 RepID=A0A8J3END9_9BACL|nr:aldose epimerase family protein [Pullulanibacillus pueri]MBM7683014.1 aldose 1-epimerase [Pullulanibacillus pueri]GGH85868.1 aldose 1-epimerase [Pullulanibacillus pueri]
MKVSQEVFGQVDGKPVHQFTIENEHGMVLSCLDYGCIITKLIVPDRKGIFENVVLGFDTLEEYQKYSPYFGAVVGRVAGRIANGAFELDGENYQLPKNEKNNHLHGGPHGFSHVLWDVNIIEEQESVSLEFTYRSPDGEAGYPGTVDVKVTYIFNEKNELHIHYDATTDQTTLVNLTNHSYFNLSGNLKRDVLNHTLFLDSDQFIELNDELLPTGQRLNVEGTPFDFRASRKIADGPKSSHPQNQLVGKGYDHPFLLNKQQSEEIKLTDEASGRALIVETSEPSVVLYTCNQLEEGFDIRGVPSRPYLGVCLETQSPPDSIHHSHFQQCILEKGQDYHTHTLFKFMVKDE